MIFTVLLLTALVGLPQHARDVDNGNALDHICGKLVRSMPHPVKGRTYIGSVQETALAHVTLTLLPRQEDVTCCVNLPVVAKAITDDNGQFEFKNVKSSFYWLVTRVDEHQYKMPIRYQATNSPNDRCSDLSFEIEDAGLFELGRIISH